MCPLARGLVFGDLDLCASLRTGAWPVSVASEQSSVSAAFGERDPSQG